MKVIIAGSRTFNDYGFLKQYIDNLNIDITEVVCGNAAGADTLGKQYAQEKGIKISLFPAQ